MPEYTESRKPYRTYHTYTYSATKDEVIRALGIYLPPGAVASWQITDGGADLQVVVEQRERRGTAD